MLTGSFLGLTCVSPERARQRKAQLRANISIDGMTATGKSTIGKQLAAMCAGTVIDTGFAFWFAAHFFLEHRIYPQADAVAEFLLAPSRDFKEYKMINAQVEKTAVDPRWRAIYVEACNLLAAEYNGLIFIGRDTWRFIRPDSVSFLITATLDTRAKRKMFRDLVPHGEICDQTVVVQQLRQSDSRDAHRLPAANGSSVIEILNDQSDLSKALREIQSILEAKHVT